MRYYFDYIFPEMDSITRREVAVQRFIDKELSYQTFDNAYVLPSKDLWVNSKCYGGVVTESLDYIESSAWHEGKRCDKYDFNQSDVTTDDSTVIYLGFYNKIWGHVITDNLKKLWFLKTKVCQDLLERGAKLIYISLGNEPMPTYVYRLFDLAGVDLSKATLVKDITRFSRIIIPDNSFIAKNGERYFTREYQDIINTIKSNIVPKKLDTFDKIYYTKTRLKGDKDTGEKTIERVFEKEGYKVIAPEEHMLSEQIYMLMNCKYFASTEGSISHNAIFCQPGTNVTILRKCNDVNKYQIAVNEVADLNVTYIDAHHSVKVPKNVPWEGPFYLCINDNLERFFGRKILHLPFFLRIDWYFYRYQDSRIIKKIKRAFAKL